ncbi:MAG: OmpA family protein [Deltaproteobacteria bacterium]|nr:OmpA family protein [Deltaproteobacteria bacterium]
MTGLPTTGQCQNDSHEGVQLHLQAGYTALDTYGVAQIDDALALGLATSYTFPFRLQLGLAYQHARTNSILSEQARLRSLRIQTSYLFLEQSFSPYVIASAGRQWAKMDQIDTYKGMLLSVGSGMQTRWNEIIATRIGIDVDFIYVKALESKPQVNWTFYVGTSLYFGPYTSIRERPIQPLTTTQPKTKPGLIQPQHCQNVPEGMPTDEYGCPLDFDGDLVPDYTDLCPGTQTQKVDHMGCPVRHFARGIIEHITFLPGTAQLSAHSYKYLDKIASALKRFSQLHYTIEAHTDAHATPQDSQQLSENRAETVKQALVRFGLPQENISSIGYGQQYPIAPNDTQQGRELNRRIEIKWKSAL